MGFTVMSPNGKFLAHPKYGDLRLVDKAEEATSWESSSEANDRGRRFIRKVGDIGVSGYRIMEGENLVADIFVEAQKMELVYEKRRVADLLISAFEGGSNYWYVIEEFIEPPTVVRHTGLDGVFRHVDYPLSEGGALVVSDAKGTDPKDVRKVRLDWPKIQEGLVVMARKYPRHFGHWMSEDDDADTADVFLQCCLFGETVYG